MGSLDTKDCTLLFRQKSDYADLYENWDTLHLCMNFGARGGEQENTSGVTRGIISRLHFTSIREKN